MRLYLLKICLETRKANKYLKLLELVCGRLLAVNVKVE